jgi:site-specific recombinase XerD
MLSKGVAVTTISSVLGHADKSSTDVYLQTDEARMRECVLDLADISMNCGGLT